MTTTHLKGYSMDEIKVAVVKYPDRTNLMLRYIDPITGKQQCKSAKTTIKREAERAAAKWESELREGRYCGSRISWADFRKRYENEVLSGLADGTDAKACGVFNAIENHINPKRLRDLSAERLSAFQAKLREAKLAESTIASMLAHLRAALQWSVRMRLLAAMPAMDKPKRTKGGKVMKGRPIAGEEFDRMLGKVAAIVGDDAAYSWQHYLRGLWLSGLRLGESLALWWDRDDRLCVDLAGKYPMLRIPAELEKGHKDRLLPIAPEFAEFLLASPEAERNGPVFNPLPRRKNHGRPGEWWVSRVVCRIGKKAGIKVNTDANGKVKYASAHDLRRSFGERWSSRVMPQVLKELMRHESIDTTMKFYVGRNAQSTAAVLWAAVGNTSGNTPRESVSVSTGESV
jgi:integrase